MEISEYPKFTKLSISHRKYINKRNCEAGYTSDFNFLSLYSWNIDEDFFVSRLNDNLVLRIRDYVTHDYIYTFLGRNNIISTIDSLLHFSKDLKLIPEYNIRDLNEDISSRYFFIEDIDNHDYILSAESLITMLGKKFYNKRRNIRKFEQEFPAVKTKIVKNLKREESNYFLEIFDNWAISRGKFYDEIKNEREAFRRSFRAFNNGCNELFVLVNKNKGIAFALTEVLDNEYVYIVFAKADISFVGIFDKLMKEIAIRYDKLGYKYLNIAQDLGDLGLRQFKMGHQPIHFNKKFIIKKKY